MKFPLPCLLALLFAAIGYGAITPNPNRTPFTAKELAQGYRDHTILAHPRATHRATIDREEADENVTVKEKFDRMGGLRVITVAGNDDVDAAVARLNATGRYDFVERDYLHYSQATRPNDPGFSSLWALENTGQAGGVLGVPGDDIKAVAAWDVIHDAPNVVVAILDTGIALTHQDITPNLWTNPSPTNGDLHGANYVGGDGVLVTGDPTDDNGHGTHVAGTIGAAGNNGLDSTGVAWKVKLMAVKVLSSTGVGSSADIVGGVNYALAHGATIINASFGDDPTSGTTGYSQGELTAVTAARNYGVIYVAAAGNSSADLDVSRSYPASFPIDNIVTVGSSNRRDEVSTFSNYGAAVDLFAPGEEILSLNYKGGTITYSGTSMAAPQVSGAFALLKAQFPTDNYRQLINRLLRSVDRGPNFTSKSQTGGRLNLYKAVTTQATAVSTNDTRPFNDDFADRPHFTQSNLTIRSNNSGATTETTDPVSIAGFAPSATLWWEWTAPATAKVSVDTSGSGYDTLLAIYTGTTAGALTEVASNDNDATGVDSRLTFTAQAGTTYQIAVGGKNGATGLTILNVGTTPANDAFATPVVLTGQSVRVDATNLHCSRELGEPSILTFTGDNSVWYQWTAPRTARFQVSARSTDFDPIMAVYTGDTLSSLTTVTASDNTGTDNSQTAALCTIDATGGTTYRIAVESKSASSSGQFTLTLVDSVWQATTANNVTGSPAVAPDGTVYVGSDDKSLYAFKPDGTPKWTVATGGSIDSCSPAIGNDGTVYFGSNDGYVYAVAADGTTRWKHVMSSSATLAAGYSPAIAADGTIYARASDGYLHALSPTDGSELWKANVYSANSGFYGNPVVGPDGTIYQGSDEYDKKLYALDSKGALKWSAQLDSGVYGAPAIDASGNLYVATLTGGIYSFTASGTQRWYVVSGGNVSSSVTLNPAGTTLYYAGYDAKLYACSTANGTVAWKYPLGDEVRASSPALDGNGVIYIGCYDGKLYAVNADGTRNREYDTGDVVRSAPAISGTRLYVGSSDHKLYAFDLPAGPSAGLWAQYRANARRLGRAVADIPFISAHPQSITAVVGYPVTLSVTVTGQGPFTYQWKKDGNVLSGATNSTYTVASATTSIAGSYTVTVTNVQGSVTSNAAAVSVDPPNPGRLMNVSVRTTAGSGDQTLLVGFVVKGTGSKPLVVRGIGPTLSVWISDQLNALKLDVVKTADNSLIASNTTWGGSTTLSNAFSAVGAFPLATTSADAALIVSVPVESTGTTNYSARITALNGATGTALAEVYDYDPLNGTPATRIINVSARAQVGTGGNILIAGFNVSGNVPKQFVIRGVGPALSYWIPTGYLANPKLEIYDQKTGALVASNDDWGSDSTLTAAFGKVGAFGLPAGSQDAAMLITLAPGTYTAQVSGVGSTTGIGLVEVYEVP